MPSGGGSASAQRRIDRWLFLAAKQLGSEAATRNSHCEAKSFKGIVKIFEYSLSQSHSIKKLASFILIKEFGKLFSLTARNLNFSPLGGRLEFVSELERTYKYKRGVKGYKNTARATECAMTNVGADSLKIASHSEDNNILSPKNLLKELQEDLSLGAQDDENDIWMVLFSGIHRSCYGRSALPCRHEILNTLSQISNFRHQSKNLAQVEILPSAQGGQGYTHCSSSAVPFVSQ